MSEPIISVRNLTKAYRLYSKHSDRFKEALWPWKHRHSLFYALNDVSFDVYKGEHIGIVGVNGAGKSTLLQILTGVLTPTSGTVEVKGTVAAMLELGSGFNPELTGRENVVFQLQLAGISAADIPAKLQEAEAFADVGEFFDQPAKTYSSGMFSRVAFASSIFTEPDILIIDEALAVGDIRFQKKCMDRLNKMKEAGVTILLVTHDIYGAKASSSSMLLIHQGRLQAQGDPEYVATQYMNILYPPDDGQAETSDYLPVLSHVGNNAEKVYPPPPRRDEYVLEIDPKDATNIWGYGGVELLAMRCYGLERPNLFVPERKITFELDLKFNFPFLCQLAKKNHLADKWTVGLRIDTLSAAALTTIPGDLVDEFTFEITSHPFITIAITAIFPYLAKSTEFISPGIGIGAWGNRLPLISLENIASLQCEHDIPVNGLLNIASTLTKYDIPCDN